MTGQELLQYQIDDCTYQLQKVLEGMSEETLNYRLNDSAMSPRETVAHFCECYTALLAASRGEQHSWGTFKVADCDTQPLLAEFWDLRGKAVATNDGSEKASKNLHMFLLAHDYYHIGQMALVRVTLEPSWDPYSIYPH